MPSTPKNLLRRRFIAGATALLGGTALGVSAATSKGRPREGGAEARLHQAYRLRAAGHRLREALFEDEGLSVTLEAQANWKVLLDRVIDGQLDGAHMLAGQPLGATIGFGTKPRWSPR